MATSAARPQARIGLLSLTRTKKSTRENLKFPEEAILDHVFGHLGGPDAGITHFVVMYLCMYVHMHTGF